MTSMQRRRQGIPISAANDGDDNEGKDKSILGIIATSSFPPLKHTRLHTLIRFIIIITIASVVFVVGFTVHIHKLVPDNEKKTFSLLQTTACIYGQDVLDFAKDGSSYNCLKNEDTRSSNISRYYKYKAHNYKLPKTEILLLNQHIGNVIRICEGETQQSTATTATYHRRCVLPIGKETSNINSPMPIRTKHWMAHRQPSLFGGSSLVVYYSSHDSDAIGMLALNSTTGIWKNIQSDALEFEPDVCHSLHSPSIFVDEDEKRLYMYVHGHGCVPRLNATSHNYQPTLLYQSDDGISWKLHKRFTRDNPYLFHNLFYLSNPVLNVDDGYYYAMARINSISGVVLCRSNSIEGPFEWGPKLGLSLRHFDVHFLEGTIYVLYSMIGDTPERILLGTIDTTGGTDWNGWKLLPGPRILEPRYWYEHQNAVVTTSKEKKAKDRHRISDPRLLLDEEMGPDRFLGLMFYSVQGEREIATARISIDLASYRNATSYRDHRNIQANVLTSTSLVTREDETEEYTMGSSSELMQVTDLLVTGVGRIGTTSLCTLLRELGIMVSHDNDVDCGPYPGLDGAVSWHDAFKPLKNGRRYKYVIHMVRDPLQTINSRIAKCELFPESHLYYMKRMTRDYEEYTNSDTCSSVAIKNWVRRNSFVENHASWRVRTESVFSDPLSLWELCMAAGFGQRCPDLTTIKAHLKNNPTGLNSFYLGATPSKEQTRRNIQIVRHGQDLHSWESLTNAVGRENYKYIEIAKNMAIRYGYNVPESTSSGFDCKFTEREYWDCFVDRDIRHET